MQEIALLNIVLLLIILFYYNRTKNWKTLCWLLPLFCFWANAHGSFPIGIFILCFLMAVKAGENIIAKYSFFRFLDFNERLNSRQIAILGIFSCLSIAVTLFNPYGAGLYDFLGGYANGFYMTRIAEWMPAYYLPLEYKQLIYCAMFSAAIVLTAVSAVAARGRTGDKINLWYYALSFFFLLLAFKSKRHFPLFFVVSLPLLVEFFGRNASAPPYLAALLKNNPLIKIFVFGGILLAAAGLTLKTNFTGDPFHSPQLCRRFPCRAVTWLKDNPEYHDLKIFNLYGWGGYLLWERPDKKIFIDGRLPLLPFAGHTMLEEYFEFFEEEKAPMKLEQYDINLVILNKKQTTRLNWFEKYALRANEETVNEKREFLRDYLADAPGWTSVYNDNVSDVYAKTN